MGARAPLALIAVVLLGLYAFTMGALPPAGGPVYSVAQVTAGLRTHPRRWAGRSVAVRGVAMRPTPDGFVLLDHAQPPAQALWVASPSHNWRLEALVWAGVVARYIPGLDWHDGAGPPAVYRLRLPATWCAQGDQCPSRLAQ